LQCPPASSQAVSINPFMATHLILGCGYLGRVVARRWLAAGDRVVALTRAQPGELRALGIDPILGDVTNLASLKLPSADTVLYAIGLDRSSRHSMREVYLRGLDNVLNVLPTPRRFIYISSTSVYGQTDGVWVDENSPTEPAEENGRIVLECEQLLRRRLPDAIILRFAGIYGPGRLFKQAAVEKGEPLATDPDKLINLIHVEDGARAVVAAGERGRPGAIYNVCDSEPVLRRDFYNELAELLRAPAPRFEPKSRDRSSRRISNRRLRTELGVELKYPDFRAGLRQAIGGGTVPS
jgi:nucleoside-diphosphate-sugar epimerase